MSGGHGYRLDTNIVSETRKTHPDQRVTALLAATDAGRLVLSVLPVGEWRKGVAAKRRSDPAAAARIGAWIDDLETTFSNPILPIDRSIARRWGELSAGRGRPAETLIAATAIAHDLTLVTRNTDDRRGIALSLIDPCAAGPART